MNRSYLIAILIAVVSVVWVASGVVADPQNTKDPKTETVEKAPQVRIRASRAEPVTNDILLTGQSAASRRVTLLAEIEGKVEEVTAERGQKIMAGDEILQVEKNDLEVLLVTARKTLAQKDTEYKAAKALASQGYNSKIKLATATSEREAARAVVSRAEIDLKNTVMKAPFDGVLQDRMVEKGAFLTKGAAVAEIVDLDPVRFIGFVSEKRITGLVEGKTAYATLPDGRSVEGLITYVSPTANMATRTFRVEVEAANPEQDIAEGLTAKMRLPGAVQSAHKISPSVLALDDEGRLGVKIVDAQNRVVFHTIDIVTDRADEMWISGIPDEVDLITVGQDFVIDGQLVKPVRGDTTKGLL